MRRYCFYTGFVTNTGFYKLKTFVFSVKNLLGLLVLVFLFFSCSTLNKSNGENKSKDAFHFDGYVIFDRSQMNMPVLRVKTEIASSQEKREHGLMNRHFMEDSCSMLFVFNDVSIRTFWMKDTYIPLDIIFVDSLKKIVTIFENAVPLSETSLSSGVPVFYAVETVGGFCHKNHVGLGDYIRIEKNRKSENGQ